MKTDIFTLTLEQLYDYAFDLECLPEWTDEHSKTYDMVESRIQHLELEQDQND